MSELRERPTKPRNLFCDLVNLVDFDLGENLCFDNSTRSTVVIKRLPWDERLYLEAEEIPEDSIRYLRRLQDVDILALKRRYGKEFQLDYANQNVHDAIYLVANKKSINPLERSLLTLEWDKHPRLENWLLDYCGAYGLPEPIIKKISKKFIIGAVRRALTPGIKFDTMLILEGEQGIGKSQIPQILAGDSQYFSEESIDFADSKQVIEAYAGKFFVEIPELHKFSKTDQRLLKAFITKTSDTARLAYRRNIDVIPRTFSFIGTTNEIDILQDETGARRYWIISITHVDVEELKAIRDQLLAEAIWYASFDHESHWLDREENIELESYRVKKLVVDFRLYDWLVGNYDDLLAYRNEDGVISSSNLFRYITERKEDIPIKLNIPIISMALQKMGGIKGRTKKMRYWTLPDTPAEIDM